MKKNRKKMMKIVRITLLGCLGAAFIAVVVIGIVGNSRIQSDRKCTGIEILNPDYCTNKFLSEDDIRNIIDDEYGGYVNRPMDSVLLYKIEEVLNKAGRISECKAYMTQDGILHVQTHLTRPVAKLTDGKALWYIDETGKEYRIYEDWGGTLPVFKADSGFNDAAWIRRICNGSKELGRESGWIDMLDSLYRMDNGEVYARLKGRDEMFYFGEVENMAAKMERVETYLREVAPDTGNEEKYNIINIKYNGQIICK